MPKALEYINKSLDRAKMEILNYVEFIIILNLILIEFEKKR